MFFCAPRFSYHVYYFTIPCRFLELQRISKTHLVKTPRFNLAFVKLINFDEITTYYDKREKGVKTP